VRALTFFAATRSFLFDAALAMPFARVPHRAVAASRRAAGSEEARAGFRTAEPPSLAHVHS
jgi:hypothetical protein